MKSTLKKARRVGRMDGGLTQLTTQLYIFQAGRAWIAELKSDVGRCVICLCERHCARSTSPWRGGRPLSPPGLDSLGDPPCRSAARGIHRCPALSPPRPWWCRRWETQWPRVSGLVAKRLHMINCCKVLRDFISDYK